MQTLSMFNNPWEDVMTQTAIQLDTPLSLPCGETLPNRLGKSAMTEGCADALGRAT